MAKFDDNRYKICSRLNLGEEEIDYPKPLDIDYKNFKTNLVNPEFFKSQKPINVENSIVWIDPVDGTRDFVKGISAQINLNL